MNKLVNLVIIYLSLRYFFPFILTSFKMTFLDSAFKMRLFIAIGILLIQMTYNYAMDKTDRKKTTVKNNFYNSLFTGLIIFSGFMIYEDIKSNYNITFTGLDEKTIISGFMTLMLTFFIFTKCLITP